MRLNKYLASAGLGSRRAMDAAILQGRCQVNGEVCRDLGRQICLQSDCILFDNEQARLITKKVVILLHKPLDVISTVKEASHLGRKTVIDLVPSEIPVRPVGRLDKNTSGLLLLTNDGTLHQYLTHPRYGFSRDYEAVIRGRIRTSQSANMSKGVSIGQGDTGKQEVGKAEVLEQKHMPLPAARRSEDACSRTLVVLRLRHGKKREIRRIFCELGIPLISLKRFRLGPLVLGDLPVGKYRYLSAEEIQSLYNSVDQSFS